MDDLFLLIFSFIFPLCLLFGMIFIYSTCFFFLFLVLRVYSSHVCVDCITFGSEYRPFPFNGDISLFHFIRPVHFFVCFFFCFHRITHAKWLSILFVNPFFNIMLPSPNGLLYIFHFSLKCFRFILLQQQRRKITVTRKWKARNGKIVWPCLFKWLCCCRWCIFLF